MHKLIFVSRANTIPIKYGKLYLDREEAMSNKQKIISGKNIYKDDKGRYVLYIKSQNIGYVIQEKNQSMYTLYANRYAISILAGIFAANFNVPLLYCLLITIGLAAFLEYQYRNSFLPSLVHIANFKPTTNVTLLEAMVQENNKTRNLMLTILYPLFGVLMIVNGIQMQASPILIVGNIVVLLFALYMGIINFIVFIRIKS